MKYNMNFMKKEDDRLRITAILKGISEQYEALKNENYQTKQDIISMIVGGKPIYQLIQSYNHKNKEHGETLLGESDWSAYIDAIEKYLSEKDIKPEKKTLELKINTSDSKSEEEQRDIQLLEQIVELLNKIQELHLIIIDMIAHACE